ncbi:MULTISPECIES: molybdenum cofactor guanylyltransferase MobA [Rhizobium]|uniref:Molybdenum cofactor guanylyltransferase n=1 Tax=Rhizobium wuzhouense TaxID=1986026 RepID=A0ABX5NTG3_9HYPH|nr:MULTISPECIES: molybdenum cofactor guanylyltransferase MobA [Rhizobium]PYB75283.1 molybdenum cofactor guanylyltransferase [Rhizobium wuzhouense]RKE84433.1 molybdenum cofactor guanylyltransferase [Rhizobium sp. AG855]
MGPIGIPGLVLGGGLSRRLGEDKTRAILGGKPLLDVIVARLRPQVSTLAVNLPPDHPFAGSYRNCPDTVAERPGPLAGVLAGMQAFSGEASHLLTVPGDAPFLPPDLVPRLATELSPGEIVMASSGGRDHPVVALWPIRLAEDLRSWIDDPDHRRVRDFIRRHPFRRVHFDMLTRMDGRGEVDPFFNINTPADLALAREVIDGGGA